MTEPSSEHGNGNGRHAADSHAATSIEPHARHLPTPALSRPTETADQRGAGDLGATCWPARYELQGELGLDGGAAVHAAHDRVLDREVAMKVLQAMNATPEDRARFADEARTTGRLVHPQIPPIHELGVTPNGQPYFTMKRVRGETLRARLDGVRASPVRVREAAFPLELRLAVVARVGEALAYAHAQGVVHRNLTPDHVTVGEHGEVQVMGWGSEPVTDETDGDIHRAPSPAARIASSASEGDDEASPGVADAVGAHVAVRSLGAILYELLCLAPPYRARVGDPLAGTNRGAWQPIGERIRADRSGGPHPPPALAAIAHRALAAAHDAGYPDIPSLLDDLRAFQAHQPIRAYRDGWVARIARWMRRYPRSAAWSAALFGAGLVAVHVGAARDRAVTRTVQHRAGVLRAQAERDRAVAELGRADEQLAAERRREDRLGDLARTRLGDAARASIEEFEELWDRARARGVLDSGFFEELGPTRAARYLDAYDGLFELLLASGGAPTAAHHLDRALLRGASKNIDGAIADLDRALELRPGWAQAHLVRAVFRRAQSDLAGAAADLDRAVEANDPLLGAALVERAVLRHATEDTDGALVDLDRALAIKPDNLMALTARAAVYVERGEHDRAIADCDSALAIDPLRLHALYARGVAYQGTGQIERAIADYDATLAIDPSRSDALNNRGNARRTRGDLVGAIADFDRALALRPDYATAYHNRAGAKHAQGDLDGAIADLGAALVLKPTEWRTADALGRVQEQRGNPEAALASYLHALRHCPSGADRDTLAANVRRLGGDPER